MSDINDLIRTVNGWVRLGDIVAGDIVFDNNGKQCNVLKAHDPQTRSAYKLKFDTGETIIADKDHLWYTISKLEDKQIRRGRLNQGSVKTTQQIVETIKYLNRETNHRIPTTEALIISDVCLPIKPYTFGAWLGDGDSKGSCITSEDNEVLDGINADGYTVKGVFGKGMNRYPFTNNEVVSRNIENGQYQANGSINSMLKQLNVYKNKHIPFIYQNGSIKQRGQLLQGLMDTDGYCDTTGWCEYCSINKRLAYDVMELASGLGIKARMYTGKAMIGTKDCGTKFRVFFKTDIACFTIKRKSDRQSAATKQQMSRHRNRFIVGAELVDNVTMRCLTVDSPDRLFLVGKSFIATHNTRTGAEQVREWVSEGYKYINLLAKTPGEARDVMVQGESGILNCCPSWDMPQYEPSKLKITWKNGAVASIYSGENPEQSRGGQCEKAWCDEIAKYRYPEIALDNLMFGLRLGDNPQIVITTTPKPIKTIKELLTDKNTVITRGSTYENIGNLANAFIQTVIKKYENTRIGRQELYAEILDDNPNALWRRVDIDQSRITLDKVPDLIKIVVAIDPATTSNEESDDTGIVVAGKDAQGHGYILDDRTIKASPDGWGKEAVKAYYRWKADRIIGEANNGGDMIEFVIRSVDKNAPYKKVTATRGKVIRAEPIAALYEQKKIHHAGYFADLEDQYCEWVPGDKSPNNLDAAVWALTELFTKEGIGAVTL